MNMFMKSTMKGLVLVFVIMICIGMFDNAGAKDEFDITLDELGEEGEFIEFKMWVDNEDRNFSRTGHVRYELTGSENIDVDGKNYNCLVMTEKGEGQIDYYNGLQSTWKSWGDSYVDKTTANEVKEVRGESETLIHQGKRVYFRGDTTTKSISDTSTWTQERDPEIGENWTTTEIEEITKKQIAETPEGKETNTDTKTRTSITHYSYLKDEMKTIDLGTFNCRVIKSVGEEGELSGVDYLFLFINKDNDLPIRAEYFIDNELVGYIELNAYMIRSGSDGESVIGSIAGKVGDEEDNGLLGLGKISGIDTFMILILGLIIIVIIIIGIVAMRKKKAAKSTSPERYPYPPSIDDEYRYEDASYDRPPVRRRTRREEHWEYESRPRKRAPKHRRRQPPRSRRDDYWEEDYQRPRRRKQVQREEYSEDEVDWD